MKTGTWGIVTPESIERLRDAGLIEQERAPTSEWVVAPGKAKELRAMGLFLARESPTRARKARR